MTASPDHARLALPREAGDVARLQRAAWERDGGALARASLAAVSPADAETAWRESIAKPPLATMRVLVALAGEQVVGFAAIGPADDPDLPPTCGCIAEWVIEPGHADDADRLLHAVADTLRLDGCSHAITWVRAADDAQRAFLGETGWGPDGAHGEIETDAGERVKLLRYATQLAG